MTKDDTSTQKETISKTTRRTRCINVNLSYRWATEKVKKVIVRSCAIASIAFQTDGRTGAKQARLELLKPIDEQQQQQQQ